MIIKQITTSTLTFYDMARHDYSRINRYLDEYGYSIIYKAPYTYVIKGEKMWYSKCMECDIFSKEEGLFVAFYKMKDWNLPKIYNKCKISELKSGDKFKICVGDKYFYTYDTESSYFRDVIYCLYSKDMSTERFDGDIKVFKIN